MSRSRSWWLVLLIAVVVITELIFRAGQIKFDFNLDGYLWFGKYPQFIPGLFLISVLLFLSAYYYNRFTVRLSSLLFPLLLLVCVGLNLQSFSDIDQRDRWHLQRLPTNTLIDLLRASHDKLSTRPVYVLFEDHFKGRTLASPPGLLDDVDLSPELLKSWGELAEVETLVYDSNLSEQEVSVLFDLEHIEQEVQGGNKFVFITESSDSSELLLITRYERQIFIVPLSLLPDSELIQ
jgi:hypothetical protein